MSINIKGEDVYYNSIVSNKYIKTYFPKLSHKLIKAVSFILALIDNKYSAEEKKKNITTYINNILKYLECHENYTASDLVIAAKDQVNILDLNIINSLTAIKQINSEKATNQHRIKKQKLPSLAI